jgi:hypothetical protein
MLAPADFTDAAARYLETTVLPSRYRWDPATITWHARQEDGSWLPVSAAVVVTAFGRFLADDFAAQHALEERIPDVLREVRKVATWWDLRAKVTRPAVNHVVYWCSGSPVFYGLPVDAAPRTAPATLAAVVAAQPRRSRAETRPAPISDDAVATWVSSAVSPAPGAFLLRSAITRAFKAAHDDAASQKVIARAAQEVLGAPRKRAGQYGWPGVALAA